MAKAKRSHLHRMRCDGAEMAGQCPAATWNTLVETVAESPLRRPRASSRWRRRRNCRCCRKSRREADRIPTGIGEFDRALGGGLAGGRRADRRRSGDRQEHAAAAGAGGPVGCASVLYVSGEESGEQVALRARRLSLETQRLQLLAEINLEKILAALQAEKPQVAVIDSIQTLWSDQLSSAPGSVAQVRECAAQLTRLAKTTGSA